MVSGSRPTGSRLRRMSLTLAAVALFVATVGAGTPKEREFQTIDIPGADATYAFGINARGDIVGFYAVAGVRHGFTLTHGLVQTVDEPDPLTIGTMLFGISPNGTVTGFSTTSEPCGAGCPGFVPFTSYGLVWRAGAFDLLKVPGNLYTNTYRANARGDIVGETMAPSGKAYGYLWRGGIFTTLDMSDDPDDPDVLERRNGRQRARGHRRLVREAAPRLNSTATC